MLLKVMIVCHRYGPPWNEGVKNMVRVLEERLAEFAVQVVVCPERDELSPEYFCARSGLLGLTRKPFFWFKVARQAQEQRVRVVHLFSSISSILGVKCFIIRTLSGIPLVLHVTGLGTPILGYRLLLRAERIIVGGSYLMKFFAKSLVFPPVSPHTNAQNGAEHNELEFNPSPRKILYLGALEPARGVDTLVDAVATLRTRFGLEDVTVTIAWNGYGNVDYVQEIREKIEAYEIGKHFYWDESVKDVANLYREHDIVVIPRASKKRMGFPLRLLEAMSYGKPVVVSDIGEMPMIAERCGLVFPHGDVGGLASAMHRLLSDWALYKECAQNGYEKASRYSSPRTVARLVELYKQVAAHDG